MSYRYIGNKTRLADVLTDLVRERVPTGGRVADLMCGTASVSAAVRAAGYRVVASDLMTFAYLHARVRLTMREPPPFEAFAGGYRGALDALNALPPEPGHIHREYGAEGSPAEGCAPRRYFTGENAAMLDAMTLRLRSWQAEGTITDPGHTLLRHDLILAANRVANIAGTYGHYRSKWSPSALNPIELLPTAFSTTGRLDHAVHQGPAERVARGLRADLCYLDPPYTKRQYAANYHLPETLARGDAPPAVGLSGLRPWRDQYSNFCSKVLVRDSFRKIVEGMDCPRFLVSYSEDGLLSRREMTDLLGEFGRVDCMELEVPRFRSNQSPLGRHLTEYVFDLERR
jgi:adenine-specific DNA-methyltransferase